MVGKEMDYLEKTRDRCRIKVKGTVGENMEENKFDI